jgi:hypothetical protein
MYKLPTYLVVPIFFLPTYLYVRPTSIEWVTRMKLGSNSDEDHPQLSHHGHPVDGALVGVLVHCGQSSRPQLLVLPSAPALLRTMIPIATEMHNFPL